MTLTLETARPAAGPHLRARLARRSCVDVVALPAVAQGVGDVVAQHGRRRTVDDHGGAHTSGTPTTLYHVDSPSTLTLSMLNRCPS
jgi:hypothetical protein